MAKRHYKTLKGLLSQTLYGQINFVDFHWNKFYHKKNGWMQFSLTDEEKEKGYTMMAATLWSRSAATKVPLLKNYHGNPHEILQSVIIKHSKKYGIYATFTAGQDYPRELSCVQGIFRNGN